MVDALNNEIRDMLGAPEIKHRIAALGARPDYGTSSQFASFVRDEIAKFGDIIRKENLQMDIN
jgi:tripartite-type tricarboxylate transporter receptor subunit TctC